MSGARTDHCEQRRAAARSALGEESEMCVGAGMTERCVTQSTQCLNDGENVSVHGSVINFQQRDFNAIKRMLSVASIIHNSMEF